MFHKMFGVSCPGAQMFPEETNIFWKFSILQRGGGGVPKRYRAPPVSYAAYFTLSEFIFDFRIQKYFGRRPW